MLWVFAWCDFTPDLQADLQTEHDAFLPRC